MRRNPPDLTAQAAQLIEHVQTLRANGDLQGAVDHLREALRQGIDNPEIRVLLANSQKQLREREEDRAWLDLVSETRSRVEGLAEQGELAEALACLTRAESQHGVIDELVELKVRLQVLRREREQSELAFQLREAQRLRDQGALQEAVEAARKVLALDPQDFEATNLVDTLILEIEEQKRQASARRSLDRIDSWLRGGNWVRAGLLIRRCQQKHGDLHDLEQLQRCYRRLQSIRQAKRRAAVRQLGVRFQRWIQAIPFAEVVALPSAVWDSLRQGTTQMWSRVSGAAGAAVESGRSRFESLMEIRKRTVIRRLQAAELQRYNLVSETRALLETHAERDEVAEALAALTRIEDRQGVIAELQDWKDWLQKRQREKTDVALGALLCRARRLAVEDRLREAVVEARSALTLDPANGEAKGLMDFLVLELAERDFVAASRRDAARAGLLLEQGSLVRASMRIRVSRRRYGDFPEYRHLTQRCRRLRTLRWARQWAEVRGLGRRVRGWGRAIPVGQIAVVSGAALERIQQSASRTRERSSDALGASAEWLWLRLEGRRHVLVRAAIASVVALVTLSAGIYISSFVGQSRTEVAQEGVGAAADEGNAIESSAMAAAGQAGDLILDALPWGRVVSIVDHEGRLEDLGDNLFTPVRLSLPEGIYRVILENPSVDEPAEISVEVIASGVTRKIHEFAPYDAEKYFKRASL